MRESLLRAAGDCFEQQGYSRTGVADITRRAATSYSNFYRYFDGLDDVLIAAIDPVLVHLHHVVLETGVDVLTQDATEAWVRNFVEHYVPHRGLVRTFREAMELDRDGHLVEHWQTFRRPFIGHLVTWLDEVRAAHGIVDDAIATDELADALGAVHEQLVHLRIDLAPGTPDAHTIAQVAKVVALTWWRAAVGVDGPMPRRTGQPVSAGPDTR
jgi:AcrR family transcriptional regulator